MIHFSKSPLLLEAYHTPKPCSSYQGTKGFFPYMDTTHNSLGIDYDYIIPQKPHSNHVANPYSRKSP